MVGLKERVRKREGKRICSLHKPHWRRYKNEQACMGWWQWKEGKNNAWILSVVERGSWFVFNLSFLGSLARKRHAAQCKRDLRCYRPQMPNVCNASQRGQWVNLETHGTHHSHTHMYAFATTRYKYFIYVCYDALLPLHTKRSAKAHGNYMYDQTMKHYC